jgi:regulator of replication initiation timing
MNRKIISSIALITIVALAVASGFCYYQIVMQQNQITDLQDQISELQDQNSELQNQNSELQDQLIELENINAAHDVKITHFEWIGGYHHLGQMGLYQNFKVTIKNIGSNNASGLTLSVELLSVGTKTKIDEYHKQIDFICAGEIEEVRGDVGVGAVGSYFHTAVGVATLTLGDVLLDKLTINLEGSF